MPGMANPMDAFITFQPALEAGEIKLQRGTLDLNVYSL